MNGRPRPRRDTTPGASATRAPRRPVVHVLYRYAESDGRKDRPDYFSRELALRSFLRALAPVRDEVAVTFLVDGEVGAEATALMRGAGEVRPGSWGSNRRSYLAQLRMATTTQAELVFFAEDDYLYAADALAVLVDSVRALPAVNWFALSGPTPRERLELQRAQSPVPLPRSRRWPAGTSASAGPRWSQVRIDSTTSTFGGRPHAIRRALWLLMLCPWSGAAWDRTTCLALQGATPYPWRYLLTDLVPASTPRRWRSLRVLWRVATRLSVNVAAITQRPRREVLVAPATPLVGHMDLPYESNQAQWDRLAAELDEAGRAS